MTLIRATGLLLVFVCGCGAPSPAISFTSVTGLKLPNDAKVENPISSYAIGDGEACYVVSTRKEVLLKWSQAQPPWGCAEWKKGPVPKHIWMNCEIDEPMKRNSVLYAAKSRGSADHPWHNGQVLVVSIDEQKAWLTHWDN